MDAKVSVRAPIAGRLLSIKVKVGDKLEKDDVVMELESMKMEIPIFAPQKGIVKEILVSEGDFVQTHAILATIDLLP